MDGLTDGLTDSAITICLPNFLWGHKKRSFFCQKLPLPVALVAVLRQCSGSVVVHSLFIIASFHLFVGEVFGPCFVVQYLVPFLGM